MLRQRIISAGLAFLALSATQTQLLADGEPGAAAPSVSLTPTRWSGFYVGIGGGMGNVDQSVEGVASKFITVDKFKRHCYYFPYYHCTPYEPDGGYTKGPFTEEGSFSDDEWHGFGTLQFGADHLIHDRLLVGVFADVDFYRNADAAFSAKDCDLTVSGKLDLDRVWNVGGRIGLLAHPDFLLYAVGGYSQVDIDSSSEVDFKHGPTLSLKPDDSLRGYFVGGGGEWMIHKNLSLKVEYRYAKYRDEGASDSAIVGPYTSYNHDYKYKYETTKYYDASADFDTDIQSIRGALVLHFDRDEPAPAPLK